MKNKILFIAFTLAFVTTGLSQPGYQKNLVAMYPFNGSADDMSSNSNDGVVYGAALTTDRNNQSSSAYYFDGLNDYIDCGNHAKLNQQFKGLTIGCWVYMDMDGGNEQHVVGKWANTTDDDQFCIRMISRKFYWFIAQPGTSTGVWGGSIDTVPRVSWHYLTGTWDTSGLHKIYVDGKLSRKFTPSGVKTINTTSAVNMMIGRQPDPSSHYRYFKGKIDDIAIFDKVLDSLTIDSVMNETWQTLGTKEVAVQNSISVYPNPTQNFLNINSAKKVDHVQLIDVLGRVLAEGNTQRLDVSQIEPGSYVLRVVFVDNGSINAKVIKQ